MRSKPSFRFPGLPRLRLSLFLKITALIAISAVTVIAANLAFGYRTTSHLATGALRVGAEASVNGLVFRISNAVRFGDVERVRINAEENLQLSEGDLLAVVVTGADGAVIAVAGDPPQAMIDQLAAAATSVAALQTIEGEGGALIVSTAIAGGADGSKIGGIATLWTTAGALARAHADDWKTLGAAAGILIVMLLIAVLAVRQAISQPMRRLAGSLSKLAQGDYDSDIAELHRRDEIGDFARHIADLQRRLTTARAEEQARDRDRETQVRVVAALRDGLNALAQRDLTTTIGTPFAEQYEPLRTDYNDTVAALGETLTAVSRSATQMRQGIDEMAGSADNLSHRTETQAATLEQTAAALQMINERVTETAANARKAEQIARGAQEQAQISEPIVREAISAMGLLQKRSSQIAQIITLIDDISFQTNLLALNAGVEAARAGESGRGFAVVASEVRALAQRSSDAAREIKELVNGSTEQVNHGVELVRRSGAALSQFAGQVDGIATLMTEVAQAANDQAHSVTEINVGVSQLDSVTQQNAAMVQQTTVAIHVLRQQSFDLADLLQRFRLGQSVEAAPRATSGAAQPGPARRAVA